MDDVVAKEMEILWSEFEKNDLDQKLEAFGRLKLSVKKEDLPQLLEALASDRNDFWVRELLTELISGLGGSEYLSELFDALQKNFDEGHDNDSLNHFLVEIAETDPEACRIKLKEFLVDERFAHKETAEWLLEFCK